MINQLCLFPEEIKFLEKLSFAKYYCKKGILHYPYNLYINRRGELYKIKEGIYKKVLPQYNRTTYPVIQWGKKSYYVHRLVACTFIENNNKELLTQVDHLDEDKDNFHLHNLEWVTPSENQKRRHSKENYKQIKMF